MVVGHATGRKQLHAQSCGFAALAATRKQRRACLQGMQQAVGRYNTAGMSHRWIMWLAKAEVGARYDQRILQILRKVRKLVLQRWLRSWIEIEALVAQLRLDRQQNVRHMNKKRLSISVARWQGVTCKLRFASDCRRDAKAHWKTTHCTVHFDRWCAHSARSKGLTKALHRLYRSTLSKGWQHWLDTFKQKRSELWLCEHRGRHTTKKQLLLAIGLWRNIVITETAMYEGKQKGNSRLIKLLKTKMARGVASWQDQTRHIKKSKLAYKHMNSKWLLEDWTYLYQASKAGKAARWMEARVQRKLQKKFLLRPWQVFQDNASGAAEIRRGVRHKQRASMLFTLTFWCKHRVTARDEDWNDSRRLRKANRVLLRCPWTAWCSSRAIEAASVKGSKKGSKHYAAKNDRVLRASRRMAIRLWRKVATSEGKAEDADWKVEEIALRRFMLPVRAAAKRRRVALDYCAKKTEECVTQSFDDMKQWAEQRTQAQSVCERAATRLLAPDVQDILGWWPALVVHGDKSRALVAKLAAMGLGNEDESEEESSDDSSDSE